MYPHSLDQPDGVHTHNTKRYRNTNLKENIYPYKKKT